MDACRLPGSHVDLEQDTASEAQPGGSLFGQLRKLRRPFEEGVATGVLRGLGDTRTPMVWNLVGHWFVGLPTGYMLCFVLGIGVVGLWWGLSIGLIICGVVLLIVWSRRIRALQLAVE